VYGIRAETKEDRLGHPYGRVKSIETVAARYITQMKALQPSGPYSLGGGCAGGVIAFEMARQLRARGEEVGPVLLFDSFVRNNPHSRYFEGLAPNEAIRPLRYRIATHLRRASRLGPGRAALYVLSKAFGNLPSEIAISAGAMHGKVRAAASDVAFELKRRVAKLRGRPLPIEVMQRRLLDGFLDKSRRLQFTYSPGDFDGSIVLFRAADSEDPEPLWRGLARGGMTVHTVPGSHMAIMEEPHVATTAALVREYLECSPPSSPKA
jgi:thioesterase domain-containing protein